MKSNFTIKTNSDKKGPGTLSFKKWFGNSKIIDVEGKPLMIFHGSTHDFDKFDASKGNINNWHGKGCYFSSCEDDIANNYSLEGPDLKIRISDLAERLAFENDIEEETATMKARIKLKGKHNIMYNTYVKMENPLELDKNGGTFLDVDLNYDEENDEYGEESGLLLDLINEIGDLANEYGNGEEVKTELFTLTLDSGGMSAYEFEDIFRNKFEGTHEMTNEDGDLVDNEILKQAYKNLGFDGIILNNPKGHFKTMNMSEDITHYVVFDEDNIYIDSKEKVDY